MIIWYLPTAFKPETISASCILQDLQLKDSKQCVEAMLHRPLLETL